METIEGRTDGAGRRVEIVISRFNEAVTGKLLDGAVTALTGAGVAQDDLVVVYVPGAFELPLACEALAARGGLDAIVALGAVIRGETSHYDYVCEAAEQGLVAVGLQHRLPVLFGVLTCENGEQALARAGGPKGNKGAEVALDALRMADVLARLGSGSGRRAGSGRGGPAA